MFSIDFNDLGQVTLAGRLDAAQASGAQAFLDQVSGECILNLAELEYMSSAGLGVLLKTHKRLMSGSPGLKLINVNSHINDILRYSGLDKLFDISLLQK